jgi:hypothetical protein
VGHRLQADVIADAADQLQGAGAGVIAAGHRDEGGLQLAQLGDGPEQRLGPRVGVRGEELEGEDRPPAGQRTRRFLGLSGISSVVQRGGKKVCNFFVFFSTLPFDSPLLDPTQIFFFFFHLPCERRKEEEKKRGE